MADKPNLIFVMCDQLRQQALGFMEEDPVHTPNLDSFAEESLILTNAVSNRPICSPFRGMLMTGKYTFATGIISNCNSATRKYGNYLKKDETCISDILKKSGYYNGYIGKWHLDPPLEENYKYTEGPRGGGKAWDTYTPPEKRHGFEFWHAYGCYDNHLEPHYWEDGQIQERIDIDEWSVKHEIDVAVNYIKNKNSKYREKDKPFSLFVSHNPPHTPFEQVPDKSLEYYEDKDYSELLNRDNVVLEGEGKEAKQAVKNYFAAITGIDEQFGRLMDTLEREGLKENTIVVFTSDHGELMGSHGKMHKGPWYDESMLIPFLIRWPDKINPGEEDLLLSVPDIMPTLLELMGLGEKIPEDVEGNGYSTIFTGGERGRPNSAVYLNNFPENPAGGKRGVRTHEYTFVIENIDDKDNINYILHDNINDPYQRENIAEDNPEVVNKLKEELNYWLKKINDPFYLQGI